MSGLGNVTTNSTGRFIWVMELYRRLGTRRRQSLALLGGPMSILEHSAVEHEPGSSGELGPGGHSHTGWGSGISGRSRGTGSTWGPGGTGAAAG